MTGRKKTETWVTFFPFNIKQLLEPFTDLYI